MTSTVLAKRYAKAMFALGKEDGQYEAYSQQLSGLAAVLAAHPEIGDALSNPLYPLDARAKCMEELIKAMGAPEMVANFLRLLVSRRRAGIIVDTARQLEAMVDEVRNVCRATVTTALPINAAMAKKVKTAMEKITGKTVVLEPRVDPAIIGGMVAKVGDLVLDGSIKSQLVGLKDSIKRSE
ncbi:MAG: ATP synthase F1 subunit delta [Thermodesulfobacteriota bacterium]